jgi:hypothetical protein
MMAIVVQDAGLRGVQQADPGIQERTRIARAIIEGRGHAAALGVAQHEDGLNLEMDNGELDGGADAVKTRRFLERRRQIGDVAHDEELAWAGVENGGGIDAAVGAGDHQRSGRLAALRQLAVERLELRPALLAIDAVTINQVFHGAVQAKLGREGQALNRAN